MIGRKVDVKYFQGPNHLEIDLLADSNYMASWIIGIAKPLAKSITVEWMFTLEGLTPSELPERIFAGFRISGIDFNKMTEVEYSPDGKLRLVDQDICDGKLLPQNEEKDGGCP